MCDAKNMTEISNSQKLAQLIHDNPELPVVPVVDCRAIREDEDWWFGYLDESKVDEFLLELGDEDDEFNGIMLRSDQDVMKMLEMLYLDEEIEELNWQKAIFVKIK